MRRRDLLLLLPDLLALAIILCYGLAPRSQITMKNAERIKIGMPLAEMEAILGPPRDETNHRGRDLYVGMNERRPPSERYLLWKSDGVYVGVWLDANGIVSLVNRFEYSADIQTDWQAFFRQVKAAVGW